MLYRLFLLFCLYLPFQLALNPAKGIDLASSRAFIIILFFLWLAEGLKKKRLFINNTGFSLLFSSFLFFSVFSVIMSQNVDWSFRKIAFLLSIAPVFFLSSALINSKDRLRQVLKFLVFSGTLLAIVGILQFLSQFIFGIDAIYDFWAKRVISPFLGNAFSEAVLKNPSWLVNVSGHTLLRATATFPDPHMLSFYLGILAPVSLAIFLGEKIKAYLWFFIILIAGDLLTFSRGGYLGLFFAAIIFLGFFWKEIGKRYGAAAFSLSFFALAILIFPNPISQRFFSSFDLGEGSNAGRLATWKEAADVIIDNPVFGVGIGNYPLEIKPSADYREPIYAHSAYLDIAAETGIINALIWICAVLLIFFSYLKKAKKESIYLGLALGVGVFFVHSAVETAIYSQTVLVLFLVLASLDQVSCREDALIKDER